MSLIAWHYFYFVLLIVTQIEISEFSNTSKNKSECSHGFVVNGDKTKCLKVATAYNDDCEESVQCSEFLFAGGICQDKHCTCKIGYHYLHGQCFKSHALHDECQSSDDCYVNFDNNAAICENNRCQCDDNFYQREYRTCRRAAHEVGDDCLIDSDCKFNETATCVSKTCILPKHNSSVRSMNDSKTKIINGYIEKNSDLIGRSCRSDMDCKSIKWSICDPVRGCICKRSYFPSTDNKSCTAELGEPCSLNDSSKIQFAECFKNRWHCNSIKVAHVNNRQCLKVATIYNTSCTRNENCYIFGPDASCQNKKCLCNENSHFVEKKLFCRQNKGLGESCCDDDDCFVKTLNLTLKCTDNFCACPNGSHLTSDRSTCVKDVTALGDPCIEDADCRVLPLSICTKNVCSCPENHYQSSDKCVKGIKAPCTSSYDCKPLNSSCLSNICTCNEGYIAQSTGLCVLISSYGRECYHDVQCSAVIENMICQVTNTSLLNQDVGFFTGTCQCSSDYHYNYGKCHLKRMLGENCNNHGSCYVESKLESAICLKGVCSCNLNAKKINNTFCRSGSSQLLVFPWTIIIGFSLKKLFNTI